MSASYVQLMLLPRGKGLGSYASENNEPTENFWSWTASDIQCMCGPGPDEPQRVASSWSCPTLSFHRFGTDTSMVPHLLLVLSLTPATYSGLELRFGSTIDMWLIFMALIIVNPSMCTRDIKIYGAFNFLGSICPRRHNIIGMISGVVCRQSISGLEVLSTDNAWVSQIKVDLCMSLNFVLVILQATDFAPPLPVHTSFNHWLQGRIQI